MGNDERRRLLGSHEQDVTECRHWTANAAARGARYGKRTVSRRERREGRAAARAGRDD